MEIQEIITKHTNEEGVTDFTKVNEEVAQSTQEQLNAISAKEKTKYKSKLAKETEALQQATQAKEPKEDDTYNQLQEQIRSLENSMKRKEAVNNFKEVAQSHGVTSEIINQLVDSGADLSKLDLNQFKQTSQPEITKPTGTTTEQELEEKKTIENDMLRFLRPKK